MLPGFPDMTPVTLTATSPAVGRTLAELNLRARTGASVLSINRAAAGVVLPEANERLQTGERDAGRRPLWTGTEPLRQRRPGEAHHCADRQDGHRRGQQGKAWPDLDTESAGRHDNRHDRDGAGADPCRSGAARPGAQQQR